MGVKKNKKNTVTEEKQGQGSEEDAPLQNQKN